MNDFKDQSTSERQKTMNFRTYSRNIPSQPLQPYLDARPVMTKYAIFPIVDLRKPNEVPLIKQATYSPDKIFNPGNDFAPWSGFSSNIDQESDLRNQIYPLQTCTASHYIPSSNSDMYKYQFHNGQQLQQPFPRLFEKTNLQTTQFDQNQQIGYALFNNSTRHQLKELTTSGKNTKV